MNVMVIWSRHHSDHGDRRSAGARLKSIEPGYAMQAWESAGGSVGRQ